MPKAKGVWEQHFRVAVAMMTGKKLATRIAGVEHIASVCRQLTVRNRECERVEVSAHFTPSSSLQQKRVSAPFTIEGLSTWLLSPDVDIMKGLVGDRMHVEVLARAGDILVALALSNALDMETLSKVRRKLCNDSSGGSSPHTVFADVGGGAGQARECCSRNP